MGFDGVVKSTEDYWSSDPNSEGIVICQCCVVDECYLLGILSAKLMQTTKKSGFVNSCQTVLRGEKKIMILYGKEAVKFFNFHLFTEFIKTNL